MAEMQISARRVAHVIFRARELDAKVGRWDSPGDSIDSDSILEMRRGDATETEVREFIENLPKDQQAELVAIMWIGRETFEPEEWDEAVQTAVDERTGPTSDYLLGIPMLPDYLESGLEKLGVDVSEVEEDFL